MSGEAPIIAAPASRGKADGLGENLGSELD
jgi:hypothetical protein